MIRLSLDVRITYGSWLQYRTFIYACVRNIIGEKGVAWKLLLKFIATTLRVSRLERREARCDGAGDGGEAKQASQVEVMHIGNVEE